jgi:hypothetical protein
VIFGEPRSAADYRVRDATTAPLALKRAGRNAERRGSLVLAKQVRETHRPVIVCHRPHPAFAVSTRPLFMRDSGYISKSRPASDLDVCPEMRISEIRREVAPLVGMTPDNLRVRTDAIYRQRSLRAILPGRRATGSDREGLRATAGASALVVLTAMLGGTRETIGPAVARLWEAELVSRTGNPLEKCEIAGALLTLLLESSDVRSQLVFFEADHVIPHLAFECHDSSRIVYAPYTPVQWKERVDGAFARGEMAHITRLPVSTLHKVARLIEEETASETD